jgi:hypothetical protein
MVPSTGLGQAYNQQVRSPFGYRERQEGTAAAMPDRPTTYDRARSSRGRLLARWGGGLILALARYVVQRVPLYRRNRRHIEPATPPDLRRELHGDPSTVQRIDDGRGALFHRRYSIAFTDADLGPADLIARILSNPNEATPVEFAHFEPLKTSGGDRLVVGDELAVRLPGPWDGPVRVVEVTETSFRLATLRGHMEAGEIGFRADTNDRGWTVFEIESWARSGDGMFYWLYERFPLARELQLHMWAHFCERVARIAGGIVMTNVEVHMCKPDTEKVLAG